MKHHPIYSLTTFVMLVLAAWLRFFKLDGQSLWADEGNSIALARRGFGEIAQRTAFDIHPPFYYWLLRIWIMVFGDTEIGLRSLSAVLGVGLVYLILVLGACLFNRRTGLIAALIITLSPLQVYYAQETRMYMLLAFLTSLTVLLGLLILKTGPEQRKWIGLSYIIVVIVGLYTHYAYPLILVIINIFILIRFWQQRYNQKFLTPNFQSAISNYPLAMMGWLSLQIIPIFFYLPWLPTAWRQITTWPSERQLISSFAALGQISTTLLLGLSWPYDFGLFAVMGLGLILLLSIVAYVLRFSFNPSPGWPILILLWLWFLLPILLTASIFSPAFLKFLLVSTPAMAILMALIIDQLAASLPYKWFGSLLGGILLIAISSISIISLYHYFTNPAYARDNYRGMARFIKAVAGADDAVILNAEGQQDVFNYYYRSDSTSTASVYPLPRRRPLDVSETLAELQTIAQASETIYGVFWATHQADPNGLIEGWLGANLFKASDQWYGNVRLVSYASPTPETGLAMNPVDYHLEPNVQLTGYALPTSQVKAGEILQVVLQWATPEPLTVNYMVFLQLLDPLNHVVGQRDAQPYQSAIRWPVNEPISDHHGIFVEPGTPPGKHRLIVGLYDPGTGQRLRVMGTGQMNQDFIELSQIKIERPATPLPREAISFREPMDVTLFDLILLGYDFYKLGHRSNPDTPLHPGDPVQLVAYWMRPQAQEILNDQLSIQVVRQSGEETSLAVTFPLAGTNYPVDQWQVGEIIRAQYDFFLNNLNPESYRLVLSVEREGSEQRAEVITKSFQLR